MVERKDLIIAIVGYVLAVIFPLIGVVIGGVLLFSQKDNPFLTLQGKIIIIFAMVVVIINLILVHFGFLPSI